MIHFVTGKPGGGKSYFALRQLVRELEVSERWVVTNLSLKLPELADYCHRRIFKPIDLNKRLRLLEANEVRDFWRHYPMLELRQTCKALGPDKPDVTDFGPLESYAEGNPGTLFILDEIHLYFGARDWMKVSADAEFFFCQHRKLRSDVLLITQHSEKVDKNMRRNAEDFTVLRNMESQRLFLGVSLRKTFRRSTYPFQPTRQDQPTESGFFRIDVSDLANCYNTAAGVGIVGRLDVRTKAKGRGPWVWALALLAVCIVAWSIPSLINKGTKAFMGKVMSGIGVTPPVVASSTIPPLAHPPTPKHPVVDIAPTNNLVTQVSAPARSARVHITGRALSRWFLSDGSSYDASEVLELAHGRGLIIGTNRYEWRR